VQPRRLSDIDWQRWQPVDRATLVFVLRDGQLLLIHKKRGLGAGKINGPGGRIEPGESPEACAVRELMEELRITPLGLEELGQHAFQFADGYSIFVHVYRASDLRGTPSETEEALPLWVRVEEIPYERMWEDDRLWLPLLLEGRRFEGRFLFDGDRMLDQRILSPSDTKTDQKPAWW